MRLGERGHFPGARHRAGRGEIPSPKSATEPVTQKKEGMLRRKDGLAEGCHPPKQNAFLRKPRLLLAREGGKKPDYSFSAGKILFFVRDFFLKGRGQGLRRRRWNTAIVDESSRAERKGGGEKRGESQHRHPYEGKRALFL